MVSGLQAGESESFGLKRGDVGQFRKRHVGRPARRRREYDMDGSAEAKLRKDLSKAESGGRPDGFAVDADPAKIARQVRQNLRDLLQCKRDLPTALEENERDQQAIASARAEIEKLKRKALEPEAVVFGTREPASDGPRDFSTPFGGL